MVMYPNLKLQLWRSGIRQNSLAKMLDMDETILSRILNGFREPSPGTRARIAALLQSEEKWLFEPAPRMERDGRAAVTVQKPAGN